MIYDVPPCPKPRMTQQDKWKRRACVVRYWEFKDRCRELGITINEMGDAIRFHVPMPKSWSKKKRAEMNQQAHLQKPDVDNYLKALQDAVADEDCTIWSYNGLEKIWCDGPGAVEIVATGVRPSF